MNEKRERDRRHEKRKEYMRGFSEDAVVSICVKCGAAINVLRTSQRGRERDKRESDDGTFYSFSILRYFYSMKIKISTVI